MISTGRRPTSCVTDATVLENIQTIEVRSAPRITPDRSLLTAAIIIAELYYYISENAYGIRTPVHVVVVSINAHHCQRSFSVY